MLPEARPPRWDSRDRDRVRFDQFHATDGAIGITLRGLSTNRNAACRAIVAIAILIGSVAFGVASSTAAGVRPDAFSAGFSIAGSNGYRISVAGWREGVRVLVTKGAVRPGRHVIQAEYNGPGSASANGISADLGELGSISLRFEPSGKQKTIIAPPHCAPHRVVRRTGTFVGSFRFSGEGGYTGAEATEIAGSVGRSTDLLCVTFSSESTGTHPRPRYPYFAAATSLKFSDVGFLGVSAAVGKSRRLAYFNAETIDQIGPIEVRRSVAKSAPVSSLRFGPHLRSATLTPPPPFSGTATFERHDGAPSTWSGPLRVSFPGKPEVPLTGSSFSHFELGASRYPLVP